MALVEVSRFFKENLQVLDFENGFLASIFGGWLLEPGVNVYILFMMLDE